MISKFNGTSTPKGSYSAKTGVNCTMSLSRVYKKRILWSKSQWLPVPITSTIRQFVLIKQYHWHFEIFVNTEPYGAGIPKHYTSCSFHPMSNFMWTLATMVEYSNYFSLAVSQVLKILWHFEILTWVSMGKS